MGVPSDTLPHRSTPSAIDQAGTWFWDFLKKELTPYPGRALVVSRVTISATIVMLLVMTFRIPGGYLGAIFTFFLSRENPRETFRAGLRTIIAFLLAAAYLLVGITMLIDDPLTHFLWVAISLFISFYLIRVFADYGTAAAFGFMIAGTIPLWDEVALNVNARVENTLWLAYIVAIGVAVATSVEFIFRWIHPTTDLTEGIEDRMHTVESLLRSAAADTPLDDKSVEMLSLYATVGVSRLRRLILRSEYNSHFKAQMSAAISLVGRLVDIADSFRLALDQRIEPTDSIDRERCRLLADEIAVLEKNLTSRQLPVEITRALQAESPHFPFLSTMEKTVALIPKTFTGSESIQEFSSAPLDEDAPARLFLPDAFSNPAHAQFALRGTLAAMVCYFTYTAVAWPGISTAIATCFITALSTIGSSRQKQILRLGGAIVGGFIFGMGAQVFVLPYIDTITGFTLLFALVTVISAWIATASARLSYLGVQIALAFYLINMQEFTIQISLATARDRVVGVLLGLISMWLFFDRLWVRNALDEMQALFARNLEMFAEMAEQFLVEDHPQAIKQIRQLRDQINAGFQAVNAQADAVLFEFGPSRQRKMEIRANIRRWQPSIRTLLQVQITFSQYRAQRPTKDLPEAIVRPYIAFEKDVARVMRAMATEVSGKLSGEVPDIKKSGMSFEQEIRTYYRDLGTPIPPESSDVIRLTESLTSVLSPLYQDVHTTLDAARSSHQFQPNLQAKTQFD